MLSDPVVAEDEERKPEQGGSDAASLLTPPTPCRPLESFESLPAADPGSARPISTQIIREWSMNGPAKEHVLLEPLNPAPRGRASSAPVHFGRKHYRLVEVERSLFRSHSRGP